MTRLVPKIFKLVGGDHRKMIHWLSSNCSKMDTNLDEWIRPRHLCKAPGHGHYWNKGPCQVEPRPRRLCKAPGCGHYWNKGPCEVVKPVMPTWLRAFTRNNLWLHIYGVIYEVFSCQKWGKKKVKIAKFIYVVFHCVAKHIIRWLKICSLFLVYSQIWLNLQTDDLSPFSTNRNSFKRKTLIDIHHLTLLQLHSLKLQLLLWCTAAAGPLLLASHPTRPLLAAV
jgi:hypothetical protein